MARTISWLFRLSDILRSVGESPRSHYTRKELQGLFELQSRGASGVLEVLETTKIGTSHLVARQTLLNFLNRVKDAEDVPALMEQIREEKAQTSRRKIRSLVQRDVEAVSLTGLPESLKVDVGKIEITFKSGEQLARNLLTLALILQDEGDEFVKRFVPQEPKAEELDDAAEVRAMFADLEKREESFRNVS